MTLERTSMACRNTSQLATSLRPILGTSNFMSETILMYVERIKLCSDDEAGQNRRQMKVKLLRAYGGCLGTKSR